MIMSPGTILAKNAGVSSSTAAIGGKKTGAVTLSPGVYATTSPAGASPKPQRVTAGRLGVTASMDGLTAILPCVIANPILGTRISWCVTEFERCVTAIWLCVTDFAVCVATFADGVAQLAVRVTTLG